MFLVLMAIGLAVIGGGVVVIARMTRQPDVKRLLDAPKVAIAEAGDAADARIEGTVELFDGKTVKAPLSEEPCVYFELTARDAASGVIIRKRAKAVPFVVRDASGYAIVDPEGATALLALFHEVGELEANGRMVRRGPFRTPRMASVGGLHQEERILRAGDRVVVIGRGVREPDPDPATVQGAYRDGPATRLRLTHSPQFPLHLLDPSRPEVAT